MRSEEGEDIQVQRRMPIARLVSEQGTWRGMDKCIWRAGEAESFHGFLLLALWISQRLCSSLFVLCFLDNT